MATGPQATNQPAAQGAPAQFGQAGKYDPDFKKTPQGYLRLIVIGVALVAFICTVIAAGNSGNFVLSLSIWVIVQMLIEFFLMSYGYTVCCIDHRLYIALIGLEGILWFVGACLLAARFKVDEDDAASAGAFFSFVMVVLIGLLVYLAYKHWRKLEEWKTNGGAGNEGVGTFLICTIL